MGIGPDSSWMFDLTGTVIPIFAALIFGIVAVSAGKGLLQWSRNNSSPLLSVPARIVSKRSEVRQRPPDDNQVSRSATVYYLTYETEGGIRKEFKVNGDEFGMSAEGDRGLLTYQGTRYYGFQRQPRYYSTAE